MATTPFTNISISALPPGVKLQAASNQAYGSHMGSSWGSTYASVPPAPCPFSPDDAAALRSLAAPLRQIIGAPHEPISNLHDVATLIIKLEHVAKKIEAMITLHTP
jgi:hypothetical protein